MPKSKKKRKMTILELAQTVCARITKRKVKKRRKRRKYPEKKNVTPELLLQQNISSLESSDSDVIVLSSSEEVQEQENEEGIVKIKPQDTVTDSGNMGNANSDGSYPSLSGGPRENNQGYIGSCPSQSVFGTTQQQAYFTSCPPRNVPVATSSQDWWQSQNVDWSNDGVWSGNSYHDFSASEVPIRPEETNLKTVRQWKYTKFGSSFSLGKLKSTKQQLVFTLLSYNVLAQDLLKNHRNLYYRHERDALRWEYRSKLLMKEIREADADIMCLQEVQASYLHTFYSRLRDLGYDYVYKKRTGDNIDGVAIYYKRNLFNLVDHTSVEYYQPGVSILDRHNVGLVAKLSVNNSSNQHIVVSTTHLLFNPKRHDVKLAQMQLLLTEVERYAFRDFKHGEAVYWPVILTGDMNFEPYTGVYKLLTEGMLRYEGLSSKTLTVGGDGRILQNHLLPESLDILDTCQHWGVLSNRLTKKINHTEELELLKMYNTDHQMIMRDKNTFGHTTNSFENFFETARQEGFVNNFLPFFSPSSVPPMPEGGYGTGLLRHIMNFRSVYRHSEDQEGLQVTTHEGNNVDYIFYTYKKKAGKNDLRLVAKYKLPNAMQAASLGPIPNMASASDHYPLLAKFCLKFKNV